MPYISSKIPKICPLFGQNMSPLKRKKPALMAVSILRVPQEMYLDAFVPFLFVNAELQCGGDLSPTNYYPLLAQSLKSRK